MNQDILNIGEKALKGEKLDEDEGVFLMESDDLADLGFIADRIRAKAVGDIVTFILNKHINYTNICVSKCKFCAFYRNKDSDEAYTLTVEDILKEVSDAYKNNPEISEVHIVGSLNPDLPLEYYEDILIKIKNKFPKIAIKAFTAAEISFLAKKNKSSIKEILERLKNAGMDFMPGGGAEILDDEIREKICPNKIKSDEWLQVIETAHTLGIKTNSTMLYGHIENSRDRVRHILKIRELQEKTGGFLSFIPLPFQPLNTELYNDKSYDNKLYGNKSYNNKIVKNASSGADDLKVIAVSRILLNGYVNNIRAYWVMLGKKVAQTALKYGANDIDGTIGGEKIAYSAGGKSERFSSKEELLRLIRGAGRIPALRTTDYKIIKVFD